MLVFKVSLPCHICRLYQNYFLLLSLRVGQYKAANSVSITSSTNKSSTIERMFLNRRLIVQPSGQSAVTQVFCNSLFMSLVIKSFCSC